MKRLRINQRLEYVYGDPPRIVRFCLGPFQDAVLWACEPITRSRNRPAKRRSLKAAAHRYGVECGELRRWWRAA